MHLLPRSTVMGLKAGRASRAAHSTPWRGSTGCATCDGFRADGPDGRIGVVDHVEDGLGAYVPDVVAVASGLWRIRLTRIPLTDVVKVEPGRGAPTGSVRARSRRC
jgi:hypothetical protein